MFEARRERRERERWAREEPREHVRAGLATAPAETLDEIRALIADDPANVPPEGWYELLAAVFGYGDQAVARELLAVLDRRAGDALLLERDSLRPWVAADPDSPTAPPPPGGRRTVAIMDYGHPGAHRASANIGDHIQSIAALGHLVRHAGVRLHGETDLVHLLDKLAGRVRPERRIDGPELDLEVITVHRDASMYQPIPADTWVLCFGWYMHALFELRHGFPLHDNLRPVFVSFHCNKRALLTPEAIEYLKRYGPVGCRDWNTVYLLLSCGVPAFFSGCITTTIDTVFPDAPAPPADAAVAFVDTDDVPPGGVAYAHSNPEVRRRSFVENTRIALDLLDTYRTRHAAVVTSRLHCYLPLRSIGTPVEFRPRNRADVRFDGLLDIDDAAFAAIRDGILGKLERVHAAILGGDDVHALWRELNAADVAAAEERLARPPEPLPPVALPKPARFKGALHAVHVALPLAKGGGDALADQTARLRARSARSVHVWLLAKPGAGAAEKRIEQSTRVPVRGIGRVARLALAELLPDVDRAIVLAPGEDVDIDALAELDLGGQLLAAPTVPGRSGFGVIHGAANRLGDDVAAAAELRRTAHARHAFDFDAFSADVLVLDLARMRAERFSEQGLGLVQRFGLRELEALHYLVGPNRAAIGAASRP